MEIFKIEWKKNQKMLWIWTISIAGMIVACMLLFPELKAQAKQVNEMYSSMGALSQAFGMNKVNMGTATGFFAIECGSILGIGGALFCGFLGIGMIAKEEHMHTAEFLYTHQRSRSEILSGKLGALIFDVILFYAINFISSVISFIVIAEPVSWKKFILIFVLQTLLGIEIAGISFGISACLRTAGTGIGIGLGFAFYFLSIYANITKHTSWAKYMTPFSYADPVVVLTKRQPEGRYILAGLIFLAISLTFAFWYYERKDIL